MFVQTDISRLLHTACSLQAFLATSIHNVQLRNTSVFPHLFSCLVRWSWLDETRSTWMCRLVCCVWVLIVMWSCWTGRVGQQEMKCEKLEWILITFLLTAGVQEPTLYFVYIKFSFNYKVLKVRPHRTRSAAADCGLCPLRNVTF